MLLEVLLVLGLSLALYLLRMLNASGTILAAASGLALVFLAGLEVLAPIVVFVGSSFVARRAVRILRPQDQKRSVRGSVNVVANLAGPLMGLALFVALGMDAWARAWYLGGVAAATADTLASDIGALARRTRRVLPPFAGVPAGTNGAVSLLGTLCGVLCALLVGLVAYAAGWLSLLDVLFVGLAGAAGSLLDSVLGSTVEQTAEHPNRRVSKHLVNFLATLFGALILMVLVQ